MNSSGKNPDKTPAQATWEERHRLMKEQVRKFRSPNTDKMSSITIPKLRIIYYCKPSKCKAKVLKLITIIQSLI